MICELCEGVGGELLWKDAFCRVVRIEDADYPGFCRVIWSNHVREMSDLSDVDQQHLMRVVLSVEKAVRDVLLPHKVNLASLGNVTPHLHWHIIPRFDNDRHFPGPIWATPVRGSTPRRLPEGWQETLRGALVKFCG
jgi:diadenosine tetraphosphate (Ap4A) HIT family hydrolase